MFEMSPRFSLDQGAGGSTKALRRGCVYTVAADGWYRLARELRKQATSLSSFWFLFLQ